MNKRDFEHNPPLRQLPVYDWLLILKTINPTMSLKCLHTGKATTDRLNVGCVRLLVRATDGQTRPIEAAWHNLQPTFEQYTEERTSVREWRSSISSSENQSPLLALWWGDVGDVGGDHDHHGDDDCGDEGIPTLHTVTSYENHCVTRAPV